MNHAGPASSRSLTANRDAELARVLEGYLAAIEDGVPADPESLIAVHPHLADRLRRCLASLAVIEHAAGEAGPVDLTSGSPCRLGDYEVVRELGRGGMGVVYEAIQPALGRIVALKVVRAGEFASAGEVQRFRAEAEAIAVLDHPHIVPVYEVGEDRGRQFYSMKRLGGGTLADRLDQYRDPRVAAEIVAKVARAVHHAHQRGILHRDLKPRNILLDAQGEPCVADFGLAKRFGSDEQTCTGAVLGSPSYMAPEQAGGRRGAITVASDVYGLGAVLYALLSGRPPFRGESPLETLHLVRETTPEPLRAANSRVDRELEAIATKCLDKAPEARYTSALALAEDLELWLGGEPIAARPAPPWLKAWKRIRRRPAPVLAAVAVGLALVVATIVPWAWRRHVSDRAALRSRDAALRAAEAHRHAEQYVRSIQASDRLVQLGDSRQAQELLRSYGGGRDDHPRGFEWRRLDRLCRGAPIILGDHEGDVYFAAYSPDGRTLATCGKDGTVRLRDPATGTTRRILGPVGTELNGISFAPDGNRLAACGDDGAIRVWTLPAGDTPSLILRAHEGAEAVCVLFTPDGRWLISTGRDRTVRRWDSTSGELVKSWSSEVGQIEACTLARDGTHLLLTGRAPGPRSTTG